LLTLPNKISIGQSENFDASNRIEERRGDDHVRGQFHPIRCGPEKTDKKSRRLKIPKFRHTSLGLELGLGLGHAMQITFFQY
jgi:hypothetical protein